MSEQSPYDASSGGLPRLAGRSKRRAEERLREEAVSDDNILPVSLVHADAQIRRLQADRDRLAAEVKALRAIRDAATDLIEYEDAGAKEAIPWLYWDEKFTALAEAIDAARAASSARNALDELHQMDHEDNARCRHEFRHYTTGFNETGETRCRVCGQVAGADPTVEGHHD